LTEFVIEIEGLDEREPKLAPKLEQEYYLPRLLKPLSLYDKCVLQLKEINNKVLDSLSLSPCKRYTITITAIKNHLMQGSLHKIEVKQACAGQIATHKVKLNARLSLQKGGLILALDALD
jgi:hypothetical protein